MTNGAETIESAAVITSFTAVATAATSGEAAGYNADTRGLAIDKISLMA